MGSFNVLFMLVIAIAVILDYCASASVSSCSTAYSRFTEQHTSCKPPNATCHIQRHGLINKGDRRLILALHNKLRSDVALGKNASVGLPPAADMIELVWDKELEKFAQSHADQCIFAHDCNECRQSRQYHVGQNIYQYWTSDPKDDEEKWSVAIEKWREEIKYYKQKVDKFTLAGSQKIGHLTQLLWAKTHRIGCGYVEYPQLKQGVLFRYQLYVCDYGPGGNVIDEPMYNKGRAGSKCPSNAHPNRQTGLCELGDQKPTTQPPKGATKFCTFNEKDPENYCRVKTNGDGDWKIVDTYSGSYAEVVLSGGEATALVFVDLFEASADVCVVVKYRKGPNNAGQEANNYATANFDVYKADHVFRADLEEDLADFSDLDIHLMYNRDFTFSVTFSVPRGAPDQFFNLMSVTLKDGKC